MVDEVLRTAYFEKTGRRNTDVTLQLAKERDVKLGIKTSLSLLRPAVLD